MARQAVTPHRHALGISTPESRHAARVALFSSLPTGSGHVLPEISRPVAPSKHLTDTGRVKTGVQDGRKTDDWREC